MRSTHRFWLTLTQWALLAGCSGQLPLDVNGSAPDHEKLPVELAGSGAAGRGTGMRGAAGVIGTAGRQAPARPDAGAAPGQMPVAVCGDGRIDPPELCDRVSLNGATCLSLGYNGGGPLFCNPATCNYDTTKCLMTVFDAGAGHPTPHDTDAGSEDAG